MFGLMARLFSRSPVRPGTVPALDCASVVSHADYLRHARERRAADAERWSVETGLLPGTHTAFSVPGHCCVCGADVEFFADFDHAYLRNGVMMPNWRERLVCPGCGLNSRMRAAVHIFLQECRPERGSRIYLSEQVTDFYRWFRRSFPRVVGSEYLDSSVARGGRGRAGIRHEDLTRLSFPDARFEHLLSFDVLEHIPDYRKALAECFRCLRPGGTLLFSVPFLTTAKKNVVLARVSGSGEVVHLQPPEYHGNPLSDEGCLCFHQFGWELLDDLAAAGFEGSKALLYWSREYGYLGDQQVMLMATKPRALPTPRRGR